LSYRRRIIKRKDRGDGLMVNLTFLYRVKRTIIIILIIMVIISFVAVINLTSRVEDLIEAQDILIEYIGGRR